MTMFWNVSWTATGQRGGAALVHVLRAATIAAVASSCSTMREQSQADAGDAAISSASAEEYPPAPGKAPLTEELKAFLYGELKKTVPEAVEPDVQAVVVAYLETTDPEEPEKLIALLPNDSEGIDPPVPEGEFLIPPVGTNFTSAIVAFIRPGNSIRTTRCGSSSGGTRYCDFN